VATALGEGLIFLIASL